MINNYYLKARLFPTILTCLPVLVLYYKFITPIYHSKLENIYSILPTLTNLMLSSAIVFLLVQINRFLSKEIFQRLYFTNETKMPTTNFLLKSNQEFESSIKIKIEEKIKAKFDITLLSAIEEANDEFRARKLVVSAISQIKNTLRDNALLLQHNIEYGFCRNLIGGSFLAIISSMLIIIFSYIRKDFEIQKIGLILCTIYFIPILFSKLIIKKYGYYYTKILYEQFLTI